MINTITKSIPTEIEIRFNDADAINFILNLYPNKNLKFMNGPVGRHVDGNEIKAKTLRSNYVASELPEVDESSVLHISDHVKAVLDEVFEFVGDQEIYLYSLSIGIHVSKVNLYFTRP